MPMAIVRVTNLLGGDQSSSTFWATCSEHPAWVEQGTSAAEAACRAERHLTSEHDRERCLVVVEHAEAVYCVEEPDTGGMQSCRTSGHSTA